MTKTRLLLGLLTLPFLGAVACEREEEPDDDGLAVAYLKADPASPLPFSDAVRVGGMLILSGQIGTDSTGTVVPGGIAAETRQTLENIRAVLERNGSSLDRVVKCTAMLLDMTEWGAMNEVYVTYFPGPKPARSAFGASGLALGARLELECWATVAD
jgi:2-iminobutanoate/2-iminopropanoate deaminase